MKGRGSEVVGEVCKEWMQRALCTVIRSLFLRSMRSHGKGLGERESSRQSYSHFRKISVPAGWRATGRGASLVKENFAKRLCSEEK